MNPSKVERARLKQLTDLPNIGKAGAADLRLLGYQLPDELIGANPFEMYDRLCSLTAQIHDPCVLDVFMSVTDFMNGGPAKAWWHFTEERKSMQLKR